MPRVKGEDGKFKRESDSSLTPAKTSNRCKVCNHFHRAEIEKLYFIEDKSLVKIVKHCKDEYDFKIGKTSLDRHFKQHTMITNATKQEYVNSTAQSTTAANEVEDEVLREVAVIRAEEVRMEVVENNLDELSMLDTMIGNDYSIYQATIDRLAEEIAEKGYPNKNTVQLLGTINANINKSMETKMKMLGTDAGGRIADSVQCWTDLMQKSRGLIP